MNRLHTNKWLAERYRTFNRVYFQGRLPCDTVLLWTPSLPWGTWARTYWSTPALIVLHRTMTRFYEEAEFHLLHEMAHVATKGHRHGKYWQNEMLRLAKIGAFRNRW